LSISISRCSIGNSESCEEAQYNFDLATGYSFGLEQILKPNSKQAIKDKITAEFEIRLNNSKASIVKDGSWSEYNQTAINKAKIEIIKFEPSAFKLSEKGLTFIYVCNPFSMAEAFYAPSSDYFFSWEDLKPYLNESSPISTIVK
jgi:hypothetical protein